MFSLLKSTKFVIGEELTLRRSLSFFKAQTMSLAALTISFEQLSSTLGKIIALLAHFLVVEPSGYS